MSLTNQLDPVAQRALSASTLLPFEKKSGGVRPIAIGETLRCIAAKVALHQVRPAIRSHLEPNQFALSLAGTEKVAHAGQVAVEQGQFVAELDVSNAFNSVALEDVRAALTEHCPCLLGYFESFYRKSSALLLGGGGATSCCFSAEEEVAQGDPLGPALFCLAYQSTLEATAKSSSVSVVAYADDVFIMSPSASEISTATKTFEKAAFNSNLKMNRNKSLLYAPPGVEFDAEPPLPVSTQGLNVAGCPIGSTSFVNSELETRHKQIDGELQKLGTTLNDDLHSLFFLVTYCLTAKAQHLLRLLPPSATKAFAQELDNRFYSFMGTYFELPMTHNEQIRRQLSLPLSHGGCHVQSMEHAHKVAFYSSLVQTGKAVGKALASNEGSPPEVPPLFTNAIQDALSHISSFAVVSELSLTAADPKQLCNSDKAFIQRSLMAKKHTAEYNALYDHIGNRDLSHKVPLRRGRASSGVDGGIFPRSYTTPAGTSECCIG